MRCHIFDPEIYFLFDKYYSTQERRCVLKVISFKYMLLYIKVSFPFLPRVCGTRRRKCKLNTHTHIISKQLSQNLNLQTQQRLQYKFRWLSRLPRTP